MENTLEKIERSYIKMTLGLLGSAVVLIFLGWGGCHFYQGWESRHLVRRASALLSGGDVKAATLSARRALQLNAENPEAARVLADAAERTGDRSALDWRRKVVELQPGSAEDVLLLVRCALQFNDPSTAERTLSAISETGKLSAAYQAAAAQLAQAKKNQGEAEAHWRKAVELSPNDKSYQLELAATQLVSPHDSERQAARAAMGGLRHDEKWGAAATRALIIDGVAHHQNPEQLRDLARELQAFPKAPFADRMLYLEILRELKDPDFTSALTKMEKDAPSKPGELATLLGWMNKNQMSLLALDFAKGLPADELSKWPVPIALADSYARLSDWPALERLTRDSTWGNFNFLRRACLARALRGAGKDSASQSEWAAAVKEASAQGEALSLLTQTISEWGWDNEAVELLWTLTRFPDKKTEALHALYLHYASSGDTPGLYRVLSRLAEIEGDPDVKNNLAQTSLLLNAETGYARKMAEEVYRQNPANAAYATTYAYSLYSKGDTNGALKVMTTLTDQQRREPAISAYYGIFLTFAGEHEKARQFLERSDKANLLPEEKALIEQAKKRLESRR